MADWDANFNGDATSLKSSPSQSLRSVESRRLSNFNKENSLHRFNSETSTVDSEKELIINGGGDLKGESKTESGYENLGLTNGYTEISEIPPRSSKPSSVINGSGSNPGTVKDRVAKSPFAPSAESIPEEEITIPKDGNISSFTVDQIANFFRCLKIDDRIISYLHRKNVSGKRFARMKDSELENVGMKNNPVILYFREKSSTKAKKGSGWVL